VRELSAQLRELEERTGAFQREADSGAQLIAQLEETLRVQETARRKLEAVIARQGAELESWRREAAALQSRLETAEQELARLKTAQEDERRRMNAELKTAMATAEAVRREGIEALEQARSIRR
jgi:chromosome segregation ATPase